jgi:hypothetical protein
MYLVDNAIPCVASIVDDDVDFAIAELGSLLYELGEVCIVEHVTSNSDCATTSLVDLLCGVRCLGYSIR